ncbi:unnamed protein product [Fraxinus pennsylvanica]|uniref:MATH domain-containing protein n=1 Tax=Fraxinus pennsylvanica TaxID=56036 RepID=A0AAD2ACR4_9LAMI|nr:unnamed protein product [Fraxinus pennsylvanica]
MSNTSEKTPNPVISPTSSRSVPGTVNGSQRLVIQGYSLAKGMGIGNYIASDIHCGSEGTDVKALFELSMIDQSGKGKHKVHSQFDTPPESGPYTLKYCGSMWGFKRFYNRDMLETSDYPKDDCLEINCTVGVVVSAI